VFAVDARRFARRVLGTGHPAADTVDLCVTELFANAVAYSRSGQPGGTVVVAIQASRRGVVVAVVDRGSSSAPVAGTNPAGPGERGRGLFLVSQLTDEWGSAPGPGGRAVWFRCGGER
jgi:anti-sigma regulatory factor (Ser/Thr protein kinase)